MQISSPIHGSKWNEWGLLSRKCVQEDVSKAAVTWELNAIEVNETSIWVNMPRVHLYVTCQGAATLLRNNRPPSSLLTEPIPFHRKAALHFPNLIALYLEYDQHSNLIVWKAFYALHWPFTSVKDTW